jgi:predicted MFS family arabinose efflux permease
MTGHINNGERSMSPSILPSKAPSSTGFRQFAPLIWLALGTFATGTESFMIAPLLPGLARDLSVTLTVAGQLVTVFGLTYAVSSPALSALTAGIGRRKLLLASMAAFALANFVASSTTGFWQLLAARVVPLGAIVGHVLGWRMTFVGVGLMAAIAVAGLFVGIPRGIDKGLSAPSIRERLAVVQQVPVLIGLLVTALWATGAYTVYTFFTPYLTSVTGIDGAHVGIAFFIWGASAVTGLFLGGTLSDKFGPRAVMIPAFMLLALAFTSLSATGIYLSGGGALAPVLAAIVVWGLSAWAFFPAQQSRLMQVAGAKTAPIVLSLNASFMYLGFSLGAMLGSFTLLHAPLTGLGLVGAACEIAALLIVLPTVPRRRAACLTPAPDAP